MGRAYVIRSVVPNSLRPHGPQPARLLCPWDFPVKNTGMGCHFLLFFFFCHFLLQGDLPNPGIKPASLVSPALAGGFFTAVPLGSPKMEQVGF